MEARPSIVGGGGALSALGPLAMASPAEVDSFQVAGCIQVGIVR